MTDILKVQNLKILEALPNHDEGEVAFCEDEQAYMIYKNGNWMPVQAEMTNEGLQLNLYDLNKQIIGQLSPFDEVRIQDAIDTVSTWGTAKTYMLYGREISYFTVLMHEVNKNTEFSNLGDAVLALINDITDTIYALDVLDENTVEIWIKYEDMTTVLYLFNYENGLVTYGN